MTNGNPPAGWLFNKNVLKKLINHMMDLSSAEISQKSGSNFYPALFFLSPEKRKALTAVYAFARLIDDIVDEEGALEQKEKHLQFWKEEIGRCYQQQAQTVLGKELSDAVHSYKLSKIYFLELIDGVATDLYKNRYKNFEELCEYCYGVAGCVGLICMELFGLRHERAKEYAIILGRAFQLTNILRDLSADAKQGRIYLPEEDLLRYGLAPDQLMEDNASFRRLIQFETERALACFQKAETLLNLTERKQVLASVIMKAVYFRILKEIARSPACILERQVRLSPCTKALLILKAWLQHQFG